MRRLLQHAIAAVGIAALATGVVASGLSETSATEAASGVAASPTVVVSGETSAAAAERDRFERGTRSVTRPELSTLQTALSKRSKALDSQTRASQLQHAALQKRLAAAAAARKKADAERARRIQALGYRPGTTNPRDIARQIMDSKYGWGASEYRCYDKLIISESGWQVDATNPSSGAYGIPQSLPGNKMASAGSDWRTNPATQIIWGLRYVKERYNTPCSAWSFKQGHNWY
ncbi:MAG TPA: hypothetical protein VFP89_07295 [Propionibacteriaceae bacterium]|nr:hypothetical protein [Propionibacteriaceae bacterium]